MIKEMRYMEKGESGIIVCDREDLVGHRVVCVSTGETHKVVDVDDDSKDGWSGGMCPIRVFISGQQEDLRE